MQWLRVLAIGLLTAASAGLMAADDVQSLIAEGDREAQAGRLEAAQIAYQEAAKQAPESVEALMKLAGMQVARQETAASIGSFQAAIGLQPANSRAFVGLGLAYLHQGRYGPARAALEQALDLDATKQEEIKPLLAWIDSRSGAYPAGSPGMPPGH